MSFLPSSPEPAPTPAVAPPLEDENLLPEILLRLAPLPSSLVCTRWRRHASDRRFIRRFRAHHRRSPPPLLGFFEDVTRSLTPNSPAPGAAPSSLSFTPILDPPNRVPAGRFTLQLHDGDNHTNLGCRDGLVLMINAAHHDIVVLVWDPVTGDEHRCTVPRVLDDRDGTEILNGAVLRTDGIVDDDRPFRFQVVMVGIDRKNKRVFGCVYSSETGKWSDPVWASLAEIHATISVYVASTLVGNSLYWMLVGKTAGLLEFDLDRQHLAVIPVQQLKTCSNGSRSFRTMPAEGGGLGILELLDFNIQLWERKIDSDCVVSWVVTKTIELDQLLSLEKEKISPVMMGYCEDNHVVFLWTLLGIFMVELESLKFRKPPIKSFYGLVQPFTSVYIPDMDIGGGHDGAELLRNS